jgi:hypothetical protein
LEKRPQATRLFGLLEVSQFRRREDEESNSVPSLEIAYFCALLGFYC